MNYKNHNKGHLSERLNKPARIKLNKSITAKSLILFNFANPEKDRIVSSYV